MGCPAVKTEGARNIFKIHFQFPGFQSQSPGRLSLKPCINLLKLHITQKTTDFGSREPLIFENFLSE